MVTDTHREGFSGGSVVKNTPAYAGDPWVGKILEPGLNPWKDPLEKVMQLTPVFLPGKSHGQKSLAGYSPWVCKETDMT